MSIGGNALYAQAGGVTAVLNATAVGLIAAWQAQAPADARLYGAREGVLGLLSERLVNLSALDQATLTALSYSPSAMLATCRHVIQPAEERQLVAMLAKYRIGTFFYNGGGGAARACLDVKRIVEAAGYPLNIVHVPKTIDNDIPGADTCPGFGSAAKYLATSMREASLDLAAMAGSSSKVFILETMGRYSGWLTAACGLASRHPGEGPHLLLLLGIDIGSEQALQLRLGAAHPGEHGLHDCVHALARIDDARVDGQAGALEREALAAAARRPHGRAAGRDRRRGRPAAPRRARAAALRAWAAGRIGTACFRVANCLDTRRPISYSITNSLAHHSKFFGLNDLSQRPFQDTSHRPLP